MVPIGTGLLSGERVVFKTSLGRKIVCTGAPKVLGNAIAWVPRNCASVTVNTRPPTLDDHNFLVRAPFQVFLDSMESPLSIESIHI